MAESPKFHVRKQTLFALGGSVWFFAGFNVGRLGIIAYSAMAKISVLNILLSLMVFLAFGSMFYKVSLKHFARIRSYQSPTKPFWYFFDLKAYLLMIVMMTGGILLRALNLVSSEFIAVFYTGLGCALSLAGLYFWRTYFQERKKHSI